ncbi:MAG: radical SAM protein, partial [Oscillospiraceae bacterium]|nr:radical SAM protein [Oscillospiraceae bacterium]
STQAGCRMGCGFCATGRGGFRRDLTAPEMTAQIVAAQRDTGHRVSSLVLMGMGEPLDNYDNTLRFLRSLSGEPAHGGVPAVRIGMRHVSLSTCGLVDNIRRLQEEHFALTLSVSLHAPNDGLRSRLMPVTKKWPVDALLAACGEYAGATGRRVSFEYALIADFNDTDACARQLAAKLRGYMDLPLCHVNLIPVNPVDGSPWQKSTRTRAFQALLEQAHIPVTVRRTLGADIAASCGQLRNAECGMRNAE